MAWKLVKNAESRWHHLKGLEQLNEAITGVVL
jgi:hypothetical protein